MQPLTGVHQLRKLGVPDHGEERSNWASRWLSVSRRLRRRLGAFLLDLEGSQSLATTV
jgi:hypothetical protein